MRRRGRFLVIVLCLVVIGILCDVLQVGVRNAQAIPAFARKYDFACNVCHVPSFPKLNDFGNLFRDHGYQLGTEQELPTWEGLTKGYWPVSFRTTVGYQFRSANGVPSATVGLQDAKITSGSFGFTGLDILSFGILARDVSYGVVLTPQLASAGFTAPGPAGSTVTQDLESAFVKLDNLQRYLGLGDNNYLMNFRVGKFEMDLPFSVKRSPTLNSNMLIYTYTARAPHIGLQFGHPFPGAPATLAGNTGPVPAQLNPNDFAFSPNHFGGELAGIKETPSTSGYFRYSLEALTNNDINSTVGGGRAVQFYGHATQSFGGYGIVAGHRIGVFGMHGEAPTVASEAGVLPGTAGGNQSFSRIGVDASTTWGGQVNVFGAWMFAKDSVGLFNSLGLAEVAQEARWNGGFVEADYNPVQLPKWLFSYRYDWITNTNQPFTMGASMPVSGNIALVPGNFNNVQQHTAMVRYNFHISTRTDVAWHLEYNYLRDRLTAASGGDQKLDQIMAAIDFAF